MDDSQTPTQRPLGKNRMVLMSQNPCFANSILWGFLGGSLVGITVRFASKNLWTAANAAVIGFVTISTIRWKFCYDDYKKHREQAKVMTSLFQKQQQQQQEEANTEKSKRSQQSETQVSSNTSSSAFPNSSSTEKPPCH